jgi:hypothetical protein
MSRLTKTILLALTATRLSFGQTTFATITGTVTDPNGAVIPNATVEATHAGSNYRYSAVSNEAGIYTLGQLRDGAYVIRAKSGGFKESVIQDVQLPPLAVRRLDIRLEIGAVETRVEVSAVGGAIETETARISDSKGADLLKALPLNTRSLSGFLALTPGVVQAGAGSSTRRFAGSRANQEDTTIDGITVANGFDGTQIGPLYSFIESYEEIRIDMANNTADFAAVGQVTVVTKGGTNDLHGAALDYYTTPWFRARDPFALRRAGNVSHSLGGLISGPLVLPMYNGRNKSFFLFSLETSRGAQILQNLNPTVPLASWRQGDFSGLTAPVLDPFASRAPFPGNRIPGSRINSVSQKYQDRFWPLPNFGNTDVFTSQNYRQQKRRAFDPNTYIVGRGDHRFSDKASVFGRFTWDRQHSRQFTGGLPTIGQQWQTRSTRGLTFSYTHNFRSNLLNEFRYGFGYNNNPRNPPTLGKEVAQYLGIVGLVDNLPDIHGLLKVAFTGLGITPIAVDNDYRHPGFENYVQQFQEQLSWYRGRHNIKAGAQLIRVVFNDKQANTALFGSLNFSNRYTNQPYADFLLGVPSTASRAFPPELIQRLRWGYDFFLTDDFKVTPKLTLNLGFRHELHPGWSERTGRQAIFDIDTGRIVVPDGSLNLVSPLMPRGYVQVVEASAAGFDSKTLLATDKFNFAPRIGIAWRPVGNNTVFRTGYGIFYDVVARSVTAGAAPFVLNEPAFPNPVGTPELMFPRVFPATAGGLTTVGLPGAYRKDLRIPYSIQYNVTVEHQRWNTGFRASYIGTNTRQGEWGYNINQPLPDNRPFFGKPRRFPSYPAITYISNGGGHQYHSFTAEIERRFARGLSYQFSYVLARDIGDLERGESPENAYDRKRERAVWLDIPTHRMTANFVWQLPFGRGRRYTAPNRALDLLAGGWDLSGVYSIYSGQFLTPLWTGLDPTGTVFSGSATPQQATIRPDRLLNGNLPPDERTVNRWFDVTAFAPPRPGSFGTSAKGVIKGPGSNIFNAGIAKNFPIRERMNVRLELTSTNTFNHPNYGNPGVNITSLGQVGVISAVGGVASLDQSGPRGLRSGLRLEW